MARNTNSAVSSSLGYDVHVVGEYSPQLNCGICTLIINNATHCCKNHAFCKVCIVKYIECGINTNGNVICPGGCAKVIDSTKLETNVFADRMVNTLPTRCSNAECPWRGDLLDLVQVHRMNCDYQTIPCNNEGCNVEYLKGEFIQHDKECLFKLLQCEYCQDEVLRMDKNKHLVGCLNEHVDCVYLDIGCQIKISRSSVIEHEYEHQSEHMRLLYQNFTHCKKELSISNNENATLKKKIEDLEIKSNEEISYLKQEVKSIRTEFEEFKKESVRSIEEIKTTESEKENVALTTKVKTKDNKEEIETSITVAIKDIKTVVILRHHPTITRRKAMTGGQNKVSS